MKKVFFIIIIFLAAGWFLGQHILLSPQNRKSIISEKILSSPTPTECIGNPETISIPSIHVDATIESVGLDSQKRMDVPKNVMDTAWYDLGPYPGQKGSAVIDGHLDTQTGAPAIFWNLEKLKPGNSIKITSPCGIKTFSVTKITAYPYDTFPIETVFGNTSGKFLNLITCGGIWDKAIHLYTKRTVVFSKLVE